MPKMCIRDRDGLITLDVVGSGFLYNMVRIIAGTLVDMGRGKLCLLYTSRCV